MRIQAQIFLVISILVLAVVSVQVWFHIRQMRAVEQSLGAVATAVGRDILKSEIEAVRRLGVDRWSVSPADSEDGEEFHRVETEVRVEVIGDGDRPPSRVIRKVFSRGLDEETGELLENQESVILDPDANTKVIEGDGVWVADSFLKGDLPTKTHVIYLKVNDDQGAGERVLVVTDEGGKEAHIPIPTKPTMRIFHDTLSQSLAASAALLLVGLGASAVVSRRLARPLQGLAARAEELGRGGAGVRVPVTSSGEIGELEGAFDRMSVEMAELERQREAWRRREHLAQLGDLSRGLAHTIRNPLHTLGLAVEELAGDGDDPRVVTARKQIRRIDRWIRSFLALGAGDAAAAEPCDLVELVQECLLEVGQEGVRLELRQPEVRIDAVATGLRAALGNLLENAMQASPSGSPPLVVVSSTDGFASVTIRDRGPGVPEGLKERLFEPHLTTRPGGAGMGLFLARQLIVEMHGGKLTLEDAEGGGTLVTVELPGGVNA